MALVTLSLTAGQACAQEGMLGEIRMFAGNFAPRGWLLCDGQTLAISQNPALFSVLSTAYGGDGCTTFCLPDLRGRSPLGAGRGPGLSPRFLGTLAGAENATAALVTTPIDSRIARPGPKTVAVATSAKPHQAMQPFSCVQFIINVQGIFPLRN